MIPEVELEALCRLNRPALEGLRIHSRYLRDLVDRNARTLPLRPIHRVSIVGGTVHISLTEDATNIELPAREQNLPELFQRVNNSFVGRMHLNFRPANRPFLFYMRAHAHGLQCRIRTLYVQQIANSIDYAMVDFLARCMRPTDYGALLDNEDREDYVLLFTCDSLCDRISHLIFRLYKPLALGVIIPEMLNTKALQTCNVSTLSDPRPWIVKFVEAFEAITPGTRTDNIPLLKTSLSADAPTPNSLFVKAWCENARRDRTTTESTGAKRFVFDNTGAKKQLSVYVWTIMQIGTPVGSGTQHYAWHLQISPLLR